MIKQLDSMLPAQFVPWSTFTARGSYTEISNQKTWYWVHFSFSWKFKQIQIQITKDTWSWLTLDLLKELILDVKHGHFVEHRSMLLLRLFLTRWIVKLYYYSTQRISIWISRHFKQNIFSIPHFNSGIDHFILLKWGILLEGNARNWLQELRNNSYLL